MSSVDFKIWVGDHFWVLKAARNDSFITTINHTLSLSVFAHNKQGIY
jgi:hypothetical protein